MTWKDENAEPQPRGKVTRVEKTPALSDGDAILAAEALTNLSSGVRVLGDHPLRVKRMKYEEVATKKYLDIGRDLIALRPGPAKIRAQIASIHRHLGDLEEIIGSDKPTRDLINVEPE